MNVGGKSHVKVLIDSPPLFIRPKNTDWLYMKGLKILSEYVPVDIQFSRSLADAVEESARYVGRRFRTGLAGSPDRYRRCGRPIADQVKRADVVLCHRRFPLDVGKPVIWQHSVLDPRMQTKRGRDADSVSQDYATLLPIYEAAAAVQVSTVAEAVRHQREFPTLRGRFTPVPFFLPHIKPVTEQDVARKHSDDRIIKILFVGREARRKGLDILLQAIACLPPDLTQRLMLDVVSDMADGTIPIPRNVLVQIHHSLPRAEVLNLMKAAHVFAMPSRFESYGFTYLEAMASGCAVIGPDWEVQSELLDFGRAGINVEPDADATRTALADLCCDAPRRFEIALRARARYQDRYSPEKVANAYYEMIQRAAA